MTKKTQKKHKSIYRKTIKIEEKNTKLSMKMNIDKHLVYIKLSFL